ncbi:MAG: ABC transporter ATP-binding protein [Desulfofustis sp.]|nr:ABC transporter ATP-binding protein [Desulfofustis sp.]
MMKDFRGWELENIDFSYGTFPCLAEISLTLGSGCFYGLIGPNGSGKSTLIDLLSGYLKPETGTIRLNGTILQSIKRTELATLLTVVPQRFAFNFDFNVYDTIMMGRYPHIPRLSSPSQEDHRRVSESLTHLDIEHLAQRSIRKLSGGETQRVMIARALVQDTEFILLDEVTANLDINHAIAIMRTMRALVRSGKTVIAALHDLNMALGFCDHVMVLNGGRLHLQGGASEVINGELVTDIYQVSSELIKSNDGNAHLSFKYQ